MPPIGTLWSKLYQPQTKIVRSVAALNELELEVPQFHFLDKPADFVAKFPYGKIPAFEGTDGFKLFEGLTIARYLCSLGSKVNLLGSDAREALIIDQWIHFVELEIGKPSYNTMCTIHGFYGSFNAEAIGMHRERMFRSLDYVESYLATRPSGYLVSDSVTLADFFLAGVVLECSETTLGVAERARYPLIYAHYARVTEDERVKQFWGTKTFTDAPVNEYRPFPHMSTLT